ncbi:MAG: AAA family ATPase [Actinomycetota bacterium]
MDEIKILVLDRSEELAERVRAIAAEVNADAEIVSCTKIGSASHVNHDHEGPFAVMIAGPSLATKTGLKRLAQLHRDSPSMSIVMSFDQRPEASLREIVQVGADDVIELPGDDTTIKGAIKRALELAEKRYVPAGSTQVVVQAQAGARPLGKVFTVSSATGGCGKTFYATNIALLLSQLPNTRVALVDLDLQFGEVSTALRLHPNFTIYDVLRAEESDEPIDLASHLGEFLVEYEGRFSVLAAPKDPAQADRISPVDVTKVIETLRANYDYVVVDTPTALAETVLAAFDLSEHLFLMCTLDLPSVRNLGMFIQTLEKLRVSSDNVSLILNKVEKDVGISVDQITKLFPQGFRSTLPYAKEVSRSINVGQPVLMSFPDTEVSKNLVAGMKEFLPEEARDRITAAQAATKNGHGFFRFFRRHNSPPAATAGVDR